MRKYVLMGLILVSLSSLLLAQPAPVHLQLDGINDYVQIEDSDDFSVGTEGLTVAVWMRPGTLFFPKRQESARPCEPFVHWLGKGEPNQHEWAFRIYSQDKCADNPRVNRISFYVFNFGPPPQLGVGSFFQDPVVLGDDEWILVVGIADSENTYIYKNGVFKDCDQYRGKPGGRCRRDPVTIEPANGDAPVRLGTRDSQSFFLGGLSKVRIWKRPLTEEEIADLHDSDIVPPDGLVGEYLLNEETGTIARDTVNARDGAIFGAYRPVR